MDELTLRYYAAFPQEIAARYDDAGPEMVNSLRRAFAEGMRVLDIGAGSGRDVRLLLGLGCDAFGVEPCNELRAAAVRRRPELASRLDAGGLPLLGQPFGGNYDGVLCSAVLMHLPRAEILDAAIAIRDVLKTGGRLLLSIPLERSGLNQDNRDEHGRLFTPLPPDYLQLLFERMGFHLIDKWHSQDSLKRESHAWCNFLFQVLSSGGSRPLDQIEGILNRDRKTATYKLALFRALSEIAMTEFEQAHWVSEGTVGIPIAAVSEKWLQFYWSIFESALFIPQIRGEMPDCSKPIAFRSALSHLVRSYAQCGGLTRFVLDFRGGNLPDDVARQMNKTLGHIRNTIVKGPVTYAGGSLESGRVFQYDYRSQEILVSAAIWRELTLVGHWIQDAVILRWSELTSEIAKGELRPSQVIDLLLTSPIPERDVADARLTYERIGVRECTWSGAAIRKGFDVDHIIPFSLWHNNDLWNLVPAIPSVNTAKSESLPTRELLMQRQYRIVNCWEMLRSSHQSRFDHEMCRMAGVTHLPGDWQSLAFQRVADAVEFTAAQRGCRRWQP